MPSIQIVQTPLEPQGYRPHNSFNTLYGLPMEPKVMTKIKPVDEEDANSEIEKGEIVLDPDTGSMHKALGKPHSKGGTPVNLKDGSFIFSNFKDLAIDKNKKEMFQFKMGGGKKAINNTPAKILGREVDLEHHNKMVDILQNSKKHDNFANNSAKLMMMKNLEKAGQVAYLQETKKGESIPQFAQNTAPVFSTNVDDKIKQSMQYLQSGGVKYKLHDGQVYTREMLKDWWSDEDLQKGIKEGIVTPVYPKSNTNWTLWQGDKLPGFQKKFGVTNAAVTGTSTIDDYAKKLGYTGLKDVKAFQNWMYNNPQHPEWRQIIDGRHSTYGQPNAGQPVDGKFGIRWQDAVNDITTPQLSGRMPIPNIQSITPTPVKSNISQVVTRQPQGSPFLSGNEPGNPNGITDPTTYNTKLTPWQKITMARPFFLAAKVKTQYPLRQHQESYIPQFQNQNVQPMLDNNNQAYFNSANLLRTLDPGQAAANIQQLYGNRINANNQAINQVQNQNIQTQNKQSEMAAASLNSDAAQNRAFDLRFFDQTNMAIKNAADLREAYTTQGIQGVNDVMSKKLAFDSWLNSQQQYRGVKTYVDKDGVQHYQGTALYSPQPNFFGYSIKQNPVNIDWSTYQKTPGKVDTPADLINMYNTLKESDPTFKMSDLTRFKAAIQNYVTNPSNEVPPSNLYQKLGGKYRKLKKINYSN